MIRWCCDRDPAIRDILVQYSTLLLGVITIAARFTVFEIEASVTAAVHFEHHQDFGIVTAPKERNQ